MTATLQETLRRRPVLPCIPRLVKRETQVGQWTYPCGVLVTAEPYLLHHDPEVYPDPYAFRPERFLEEPPGTYTWIPFGGGRRRCLGATFAMLEMKIVLKTVLDTVYIRPAGGESDSVARRSALLIPRRGAHVMFSRRDRGESRSAGPQGQPMQITPN